MKEIVGYNRIKGVNFMNGRIFVYGADNTMPPLFDFANVVRAVFDDYGKASELYVREIDEAHIGIMQEKRSKVRLIDFYALAEFGRNHVQDREYFEQELVRFQQVIQDMIRELPGKVVEIKVNSVNQDILKEFSSKKKQQDTLLIGTKPQRFITVSGENWYNGTDLRANFLKSDFKLFKEKIQLIPQEDCIRSEGTAFVKESSLSLIIGEEGVQQLEGYKVDTKKKAEAIIEVAEHIVVSNVHAVCYNDILWYSAADIGTIVGHRRSGATIVKNSCKPEHYLTMKVKGYGTGRYVCEEGLKDIIKVRPDHKNELLTIIEDAKKLMKELYLKDKTEAKRDPKDIDTRKDLSKLDTREIVIESIHVAEQLRKKTNEQKAKGIKESRVYPTTRELINMLYRYVDTADETTKVSFRWLSILESARARLIV